jgi:rhamnosyl/mannosyltransferase
LRDKGFANMHIVHLYKDYAPVLGGIEGHVQTLAQGLVRLGFRITVVVCQPRGSVLVSDEVIQGVRVIRLPRHIDIASNAWSFALVHTVARLKPDVLHLQMPWPAGDLVALLLPQIPLVVSYQSDVIRQRGLLRLYAPLLRWTLSHAKAICVSSGQYAATSPWLQDVSERIHVVPLGIEDPLSIVPMTHNIDPSVFEAPYVLWVGRMRYYKGLQTAIRALVDVPPPVRLVLVGSGPAEASLRSLAVDCGVAHRILWLGDLPDSAVAALRERAVCFVFPSNVRSEAYGLALLEAIASGIPAISCEIGTATSVLNVHESTGFVIAPNDFRACAIAINQLTTDLEMRIRYSKNARAQYLALYTATRMIERVAVLYRSLDRASVI